MTILYVRIQHDTENNNILKGKQIAFRGYAENFIFPNLALYRLVDNSFNTKFIIYNEFIVKTIVN